MFILKAVLVVLVVFIGSLNSPDYKQLVSLGTTWKIYDVSDSTGVYFQYIVYSQSGEILNEEVIVNSCPEISNLDNNIVQINIPSGNTAYSTFYDTANSIQSREYQNVIYANGKFVLYTDLRDNKWFIVKSALFDNSSIQEYPIDLAGVTGRIESIRMKEDDMGCWINYIGYDYIAKTKYFSWEE